MDEWHGCMDRWIEGWIGKWAYALYERLAEYMTGWIVKRMDEWMDGWVCG